MNIFGILLIPFYCFQIKHNNTISFSNVISQLKNYDMLIRIKILITRLKKLMIFLKFGDNRNFFIFVKK